VHAGWRPKVFSLELRYTWTLKSSLGKGVLARLPDGTKQVRLRRVRPRSRARFPTTVWGAVVPISRLIAGRSRELGWRA